MAHELTIYMKALDGRDFTPETLPFRLLVQVASIVQHAVLDAAGVVDTERSALVDQISLPKIKRGSAGPTLLLPDKVDSGAARAIHAVLAGDYTDVPVSVHKDMHKLFRLAKKNRIKLTLVRGAKDEFAEISPEQPVEKPGKDLVKGDTVVYGKLIEVGQERKPGAQVRPLGRPDTIRVHCTQEQVVQLGHVGLYQIVGLAGRGSWDAATLHLVSLRLKTITDYKKTPISQALDAIRSASGGAWDSDAAVDEVNRLRHDD